MKYFVEQGVCFLDRMLFGSYYKGALLTVGSSEIVGTQQSVVFPNNCVIAAHDPESIRPFHVFHKHPSSLRKAKPSLVMRHVRP